MTVKTFNHVTYPLGFVAIGSSIRNYSICIKGITATVLKHRFPVNGGITMVEAYHHLASAKMSNVIFTDVY